mgnify:CR=1 FL=1
MARYKKGFDCRDAKKHLAKVDKSMAIWMNKIGSIEHAMDWRKSFDVVDALARAILYQQLNGKAAATIVSRVEIAIQSKRLHGSAFSAVSDTQLRECGVSGRPRRGAARVIQPFLRSTASRRHSLGQRRTHPVHRGDRRRSSATGADR